MCITMPVVLVKTRQKIEKRLHLKDVFRDTIVFSQSCCVLRDIKWLLFI